MEIVCIDGLQLHQQGILSFLLNHVVVVQQKSRDRLAVGLVQSLADYLLVAAEGGREDAFMEVDPVESQF